MNFDEYMRAAAHKAADAVADTMVQYKEGELTDEDDITGALVGQLRAALNGRIDGLQWSAKVLRHRRGVAAEEKKIGADILFHVKVETLEQTFSKGVLIQAKRFEPNQNMTTASQGDLKAQCKKMLEYSPSSFVFNYSTKGVRCGSATRVAGASSRNLNELCGRTPFRFFLDFFQCPIGDSRITGNVIDDLPVPTILEIVATSPIDDVPRVRLRRRIP